MKKIKSALALTLAAAMSTLLLRAADPRSRSSRTALLQEAEARIHRQLRRHRRRHSN